ncbi:metal-sensitive transcriptional regulator [uncultured Jannaschia sp.]|uniref:metal-sensitive transcriptional regulator n=1 Tax=uncultured Jannaschia sp. TaxID=293347 RepID=UPI0026206AEC|nr:metal-sensitive transcriptional regulator [uncultured Jannaschia sp.]
MLPYTHKGYQGLSMDHADKVGRREAKVHRLNRIAGQVQGVARMVAEDRYCMDILHQVQAVKAALIKAEAEILRDHAACCVREAIKAGDAQATQVKLDELVDLFDRSRR